MPKTTTKQQRFYFSDKLKKQMDQIVQYPLTVVAAPSGFGKTTAIREYLRSEYPQSLSAWYTCLGKPAVVAWAEMCDLIADINRQVAGELKKLKYPQEETLHDIKAAIKNLRSKNEVFWVIDNYQRTQFGLHWELIETFAMHENPKLHIIIINGRKCGIEGKDSFDRERSDSMDIYVARQPIFDRNMHVYGYELLYRKSMNNFYEGTDDNQATFELISNAFLTMHLPKLTGGRRAFINFPKDALLQDIPTLLPAESIVVEILERVEIDEDVVNACKKLREKGYIIALDDFIFDERYLPLLDVAHIIKVEFPAAGCDEQRQLISRYKHRIRFLAEKVETREEYQLARDIGYDYFQGYFFSKPVVMKEKELSPLNANLIKILGLLNHDDPEFWELAEVIGTDLGLTYKLLRLANSVYFGSKNNIRSIRQALVQIGLLEIKKWVYLLIMADRQVIENKELLKNCLIRAKFMELMAEKTGNGSSPFDYFLAGMFSSINVLMSKDMADVLNEILLPDSVKDALLGQDTPIKRALDIAINYELLKLNANSLGEKSDEDAVEYLVNIYMEALTWVMHLGY